MSVGRARARATPAVVVLALFVAVTADRAMAQTPSPAPPTSSPRAAFEAFFAALARADGPAAAALIHPDALAAFRARELATAGAIAQATDGGRKSPSRRDGVVQVWANAPPELATKYGATPVYHVPGVKTLGELAALSPADFAARMITAGGPMARAVLMGGRAVAPEVVGTVPDGDTLAHVVYRSPFAPAGGDPLIASVVVMSARRGPDGRWLLLPDTMVMSLFSVHWMLSPGH